MTLKKHDQYSKQIVAELIEAESEAIVVNHEIPPGEAHQADIYFVPKPSANLQRLGLLGKIVTKSCIIEIFRNQPSKFEFQTGIQKLFTLRSEILNKAEREKKSLSEEEKKTYQPLKEEDLPHLWILATSASDNLLDFLGAEPKPGWCQGVYFCGPLVYRTAIVAINRLPITPETLLVRLLGKGATQLKAINEIRALPTDNALRNRVERLIYRWRIYLDAQHDKDDKELLMNFQQIYQEHENKIVQQARQEGRREMVENLLGLRFGMIDEALSSVIERLLKLPPDESSRLLMQSSREELLAKLSH
jgi:hypothetical protein